MVIAIGAAVGTGQSTTFAVANDSHTPVIVADSSADGAAAGALGEGHSPAPSPR
ncbi:hypothetical protein HUT19_16460 [Streptomyces sp. NA02950]|uniref:hypothetical protein n=1 Tax=Streptomyces sp. NA02950 TaxID=2742137 RepID=UPI00158FE4E6|nr:hypothetical protein [Streptomyces sp. NA02950]QKV93150.1 hypothetical protein HUT19_16460 [Streptomyces sp. NA02950]